MVERIEITPDGSSITQEGLFEAVEKAVDSGKMVVLCNLNVDGTIEQSHAVLFKPVLTGEVITGYKTVVEFIPSVDNGDMEILTVTNQDVVTVETVNITYTV